MPKLVKRVKRLAAALLLSLAPLGAPSHAVPSTNGDPDSVKIETSDIDNFWRAYDKSQMSPNPELTFGVEYFAHGTAGLWAFVPFRLISPAHLLSVIRKYAIYYEASRAYMGRLRGERAAIYADMRRLKELYPAATFPNIYFVVGSLNSAGTSDETVGLIMGAEMLAKPGNLSDIPMPGFKQSVLRSVDQAPPIIAHELTHFNQRDADTASLLDESLYEGTADFVAQLVDGHNVNADQWQFGCAHEEALWDQFKSQMRSTDSHTINPWLFSYDAGPLGAPPFIGYWLGSRIVQTFYDAQSDKRLAIDELLHIKNFDDFLQGSGYPDHRPPCSPEPRT